MKFRKITYNLFALLFFCSALPLDAQPGLTIYSDLGKSNVSAGMFLRSSAIAEYGFGKTLVAGKGRFDMITSSSNVFTGTSLTILHFLRIRDFSFAAQGMLLLNFSSDLIHESYYGLLAHKELKHFTLRLGTGFRTYRITKQASQLYGISSNRSLTESWNMMYLVDYSLKPHDSKWNAGFAITNMDDFLVSQETNPLLCIHARAKVTPQITVFAESRHILAGAFNISANSFGHAVRTGLKWKLI